MKFYHKERNLEKTIRDQALNLAEENIGGLLQCTSFSAIKKYENRILFVRDSNQSIFKKK